MAQCDNQFWIYVGITLSEVFCSGSLATSKVSKKNLEYSFHVDYRHYDPTLFFFNIIPPYWALANPTRWSIH